MPVRSRLNNPEKKTQLALADFRSLAELRHQIRRFLHFSEEAARNSGLEPRQHQLMLALKGLPEGVRPRVGELAERLQIQHHSAVELVNRLASGGYVCRLPGEQDRREVLVSLTSKGEKILRGLSIHHKAELRIRGPALIAALERAMYPHGSTHLEIRNAKGKEKRNDGDARN